MNNGIITRDKNNSVHDNMINDLAEIDVSRFNTENPQHHITSVSAVTPPTTTTTTTLNVQIVNSSELDGEINENGCLEVPDHMADEIIKASGEFCEENITINDEQLEEMTKVCRFCLAKRDDMRLIFEQGSCISDVIMMITNIQVQQDDGFPVQICFQCILYASRAFAFKQQVEAADEALKNFIGQGFGSTVLQPIEIHDEFIFQSISGAKITEEDDIADFGSVDELDEPDATIHMGEDEEVIIVDFENTENVNDDGNRSITSTIDGSILINEDQLNSELLGGSLYCDNSSDDHLLDLPSDSESICSRVSDKVENEGSESNNNSKSQNEDDNPNDSGDDRNANKRHLRATRSSAFKDESSEEDSELEEDMQRDDSNNFTCKICEKVFKTQEKLIRHAKAKHNRRAKRKLTKEVEDSDVTSFEAKILPEDKTVYPYTCTVCKQGFNIENDLKIHYSLHINNNGKHICLHCKKECTTYLQLKRHVRTHYEDKPYKCRICRKGFPEMGSLTRHFRRHTGEQREKKHLCNTCGKGYYDSHALIIHSRTHTGERPWVCNICGKSFIDSRLLNSHLKVHSGKKPHSCEICKKSFTHHSTLTTHLRTHTGEKPYVCSVCGKTFIQSSNLSLHMRVHSGEKPYKCIVCDRRFASSSTLTMHMRIHTGEKPYSCKTCGKKFARHDLSAHIRTHTGEKPFSCQCGKRFTTTGQLNQHALTHTGVKRYLCSVCQKRCSSSTYLKKHMKSHGQMQQNANKAKIDLNLETDKQNLDTVIQIKYTKLGPNSQHDGGEEGSDHENLNNMNNKCAENVDKSDDDEKRVTLDNAILHINSADLLNVVHDSSNVGIQVPVLTASDLQSNLGTVYSSLDGKYIYQAIDPSIMRIKRESGNHLGDGNSVNTTEMSR